MANVAPEQLAQYFRIADELLGARLAGAADHAIRHNDMRCDGCGSTQLITSYAQGDFVCYDCALVQQVAIMENAPKHWRPASNYKRIHHWHERISQFQLQESVIPYKEFDLIEAAIIATGLKRIDKQLIRQVLRSLDMQRYIEKWLQIMNRVTGARPGQLSDEEVVTLDLLFVATQSPFIYFKPDGRKNFMNYNYMFHRLLDFIQRPDLKKYFPLIKSVSKLDVLDSIWEQICDYQGWVFKKLIIIEPWYTDLELEISPHFVPPE